MVSYGILGDFAVHDADGRPIHIPAGRTQQVLAKLLVNHDRVVSHEELVRAGWGESPPESVQIYKIINDINRSLGPYQDRPRVENRARQGYRLLLFGPDELDLIRFDQAVAEADGEPARTIETLRRALSLWRGPRALANLPVGVLDAEVARLGRRRRRAATRLVELEINSSGYPGIAAEAVEFAELFPTDQRLCELAMIASYRCDQVSDAIRTYEHYERALEEDPLGTLSPELKRLSYALLRGDDEFVGARERALGLNPPPAGTDDVPVELRAAPPRLIARDDLLAEATWLLRRGSSGGPPVVLVISGRSGIGKTAMARSVAHAVVGNYRGGALYLELRDATGRPVDASECLAHALRALKVRVPESRSERAAALRTELARRQMLLVLDDAHDENQVRDLIPGSGSSAVIITTHHDLPGLEGAQTLRTLRELTPADSLDLYRDLVRAHRLDPDADDPGQTERLLDLCDGLPLAIAVVAALRVRERARPVAELADRLQRMGPAALEYDDRSVARSIGASLERLDDDARALFLGLGRLRLADIGAWTAWAVLDAGTPSGGPTHPDLAGPDPYGALSQLLASNVVAADGPGRYRLHALTRGYAAWAADQSAPDHGEVAERVYRALLTLVRSAHQAHSGGDYDVVHSAVPDWRPPEALLAEVTRDPMVWFGRARANIRSAVHHCAELGYHELSWDLAVSAHEYYTVAGQHDDWYDTHTTALHACRTAGDRRGEAVLLVSLGQPALVASRRAGAVGVAELRHAADLLREAGDEHGLAIALRTLANALRRTGRLTEPLRLFEEALELYGRSDDAMGRWQTQRFIGHTYLDRGDHDRAVKILGEALDGATQLGSPRFVAQSHYWLGQAYLASANDALAEASFREVLAAVGDGPSVGRGYALHGLGEVAHRRGDLTVAEELLTEAATLAREGRDAGLEGQVHVARAAVQQTRGDREGAIAALEQAIGCFAAADNRYRELATLVALARVHPPNSPESWAGWERVTARYAELDLPDEDRTHRPPPMPER